MDGSQKFDINILPNDLDSPSQAILKLPLRDSYLSWIPSMS